MGVESTALAAGPASEARVELSTILSKVFEDRLTTLGLTNGIAGAIYSHGVLSGTPLSHGALIGTIIGVAESWDVSNRIRMFANPHFAEDVARASRIILLAAKSRDVSEPLAPSIDVIACIPLVIRFAE